MSVAFDVTRPLPGASFGATVRLAKPLSRGIPAGLPAVLAEAGGLLLIPGLQAIADEPELLVRLSRVFGPEVEDYRYTLTTSSSVHQTVPEIFIVSNMPPVNRAPPRRPEPPLDRRRPLPVQYPHRTGWHTDQSYRRPPPDISLFYAVTPVAEDHGQTLFADGTPAYAALPPHLKARVEGLRGPALPARHRPLRDAVLAGSPPPRSAARALAAPARRAHPSGHRQARALSLRIRPDGLGRGPLRRHAARPARRWRALLDELMAHYTRPEFVYVHEWTAGDLLVWDNRCLVHAATWYDAETEQRMMWRTTVRGNPGAIYAGEARSWLRREEVPA